jgi:acyl-CoA reductase-like NAD-dependent aldehyde dehydrogenase
VEDVLSGASASANDAVVENAEFSDARILAPSVVAVDASDDSWKHECFGPILFVVKTSGREESLALAAHLAASVGAITCSCYSTDVAYMQSVEEVMNEQAFTPVSFNFTGAAFVNQHAAFSDFHVTGGNPSGNATFTDSLYVNRRFVWVGNRFA